MWVCSVNNLTWNNALTSGVNFVSIENKLTCKVSSSRHILVIYGTYCIVYRKAYIKHYNI